MEASNTTPPIPPPLPATATLVSAAALKRLGLVLAAAVSLTALADFLFWKQIAGISFAIYCCAVAAMTIASRRRKCNERAVWFAAGLILAASAATAMEISFTNIAVLLGLLAVIYGECWYPELPAFWPRWSESLVAWVTAPGRWPWLIDCIATGTPAVFKNDARLLSHPARAIKIVAPSLLLAILFSIFLGSGNAVYGELLSRIWTRFADLIASIDLSVPHLLFWLLFATISLGFVAPRIAPTVPRSWTRGLPEFVRGDRVVAVWQSRFVLVLLNILFFGINTIDVFYLWQHTKLPRGVTYSAYVHRGVASLIVAVLLSAVVIAAIFQQQSEVRRGRRTWR
jgi:hypothetical protein